MDILKKIVLIIPYRGIGDLIFHLPLIRGLSKRYQQKIILITNINNKAEYILNSEKSVSKIFFSDFTRENLIKNSMKLLTKLNTLKPDLIVVTAPSKRLKIPLYLSKSKMRVIFKKSNIKDLSQYIFSQSKLSFKNIKFKKDYKFRLQSQKSNKKSIFLSLDSFHDQNNWSELNFIRLVEKILLKKKLYKIYINFAPSKVSKFKKILNQFNMHSNITFTYSMKFSSIIKILNNIKYVIGNESGPACLGAAMGKKVFSIYNPIHTPNLSSKIINKDIIYFNSKKVSPIKIINKILVKIN